MDPNVQQASSNKPGRLILACLIVGAAAWLAMGPAVRFGFTNWDDELFVQTNPLVVYPGAEWWASALLRGHQGYYAPALWWTWRAGFKLWGMEPAGYHALNIALHSASAVVLLLVCLKLGFRLHTCALAAIIWAIHPLRVESVAWITELKDCLSGLFCMLATLAYVDVMAAGDRPRGYYLRYALSGAMMFLAVSSKATAYSWLFVLFLLDVAVRRGGLPGHAFARAAALPGAPAREAQKVPVSEDIRRAALRIAPLLAVALPVLIVQVYQQAGVGALSLERGRHPRNLLVVATSLCFHMGKQLMPIALSPTYELPEPVALWTRLYGGFLLLAVVLLLGTLALMQWRPWLAFPQTAFAAAMLPALQLIPTARPLADRYTYLPSIPLMVAAACFLSWRFLKAGSRRARWLSALPTAIVLAAAFAATRNYLPQWRSSLSLWRQEARTQANCEIPHFNLGAALLEQGRFSEAADEMMRALGVAKQIDFAQHAVTAGLMAGHGQEFIRFMYNRSWRVKPDDMSELEWRLNVALNFGKAGFVDTSESLALDVLAKASEEMAQGVLKDGSGPNRIAETAALAVAVCAIRKGETGRAETLLRESLKSRPSFVAERFRRGLRMLEHGLATEARLVLVADPTPDSVRADDVVIGIHKAGVSALHSSVAAAEADVLSLCPAEKARVARFIASYALEMRGDAALALVWARRAAVWEMENLDYDSELAWALYRNGRPDEAAPWINIHIVELGRSPESLFRYGAIRAALGHDAPARAFLKRAVELAPAGAVWLDEARRILESVSNDKKEERGQVHK